jgi:hypothetical protein
MSKARRTGLTLVTAFLICSAHPCVGETNSFALNELGLDEHASRGNAAEVASSDLFLAGIVRAAFPRIMGTGVALTRQNVTFFTASPVSAQAPATQAQATTTAQPNQTPGNIAPGTTGPPSLGDLGFPTAQTQPNPQEQARLDKRTHMLKIHQRLGLITTVPLIVTGASAGGKSTSSTSRDVHAALGSVTAGLYFTTAYFSIFAPRIAETRTRGQIRLHKALVWIHGPGMILTPVLGAMAFEQKSKGEKVHGIASAHGPVAVVTAAAYGLAIVSVSIKF